MAATIAESMLLSGFTQRPCTGAGCHVVPYVAIDSDPAVALCHGCLTKHLQGPMTMRGLTAEERAVLETPRGIWAPGSPSVIAGLVSAGRLRMSGMIGNRASVIRTKAGREALRIARALEGRRRA